MSHAVEALKALNEGKFEDALKLLAKALRLEPMRIDLHHALGVCYLQLGEPSEALAVLSRGKALADEIRDEHAATLAPQLRLAQGAAYEDMDLPLEAEEAYREVLQHETDNPRARAGLGHLLLATGRSDAGRAELAQYLEQRVDDDEYLTATESFLASLDRFRSDDANPHRFLEGHRGAYLDFFDETATRMEAEGWIAEAAKMVRNEAGEVVPMIPEGARPYAAIRVDLVNPATGQPGQVGEQPMVVALEGYEGLAHAPVLFKAPDEWPFTLWISSQAPWDQLPVQLQFRGAVPEAVDEVLGDWFSAGWGGAFGTADRGRFHYISDPAQPRDGVVVYNVDLGRAELACIRDLLSRLSVLHDRTPLKAVLLGRGHVPPK